MELNFFLKNGSLLYCCIRCAGNRNQEIVFFDIRDLIWISDSACLTICAKML